LILKESPDAQVEIDPEIDKLEEELEVAPLHAGADLVEIDEDDLLPRPQGEASAHDGHAQRGTEEGRPDVGVSVPVAPPRIVMVRLSLRDEALDRRSDAVCTALQLTNFLQDLERDWRKGRLYLPLDECRRAGADTADLDARRMTPAWRRAMEHAASRTEDLFEQGRGVCDAVTGRLRWELRFTWLGGRRILERLEQGSYDLFGGRPALGAADLPALLWRALTWRTR